MRKFYTKTIKGVRCIRCRDHFSTIEDLASHYARDGHCITVLLPEHKAA